MDSGDSVDRRHQKNLALASGNNVKIVCSICIANYNGIGLIDECLTSLRTQDFGDPIEIIVHDDASNDGSAEHIRTNYPDVRLIESKENVGFCIANNRMAATARGQYLLLLNNDAALLPEALKVLHNEATRLNRPAILSLPQYDAETENLLDIGSLLDPFLNPVPNIDPQRLEVAMVMGACMWIPKTLWLELGGFPEWFGSIGEDLYLCCRARLTGHPVIALDRSGYLHHVGKSFGGGRVAKGRLRTTFHRRAMSERNKTFTIVLTYPILPLLAILPIHLILVVAEGLILSLLKRDLRFLTVIYLPVFFALGWRRHLLVSLRKEIQNNRKASLIAFFRPYIFLPYKLKMLARHGLPDVRRASRSA
jgi:GT2 family glycosyltransferase